MNASLHDGTITFHSHMTEVIGGKFINRVQVFESGIPARRFEFAQDSQATDVKRIRKIIAEGREP